MKNKTIEELERKVRLLEYIVIEHPFVFNIGEEIVVKYPDTVNDEKEGVIVGRIIKEYMPPSKKFYNVKFECGHIAEINECYLFSKKMISKK